MLSTLPVDQMTEAELIADLRNAERMLRFYRESDLREFTNLIAYSRWGSRADELRAELDNRTNSACV